MRDREKDIETKNINLDVIIKLGLFIIVDILFFIVLFHHSSNSIWAIYLALNLYIFPVVFYNFTKGVFAYFFGIKENIFKLISFALLINTPFILPIVSYLKTGSIKYMGGLTNFENSSTLLKLFIILDCVLLPILAFSYLSGGKRIENDSEEDSEDVGNGNEDEDIDEDDYEQGNVYNSEYDDVEKSGNTEPNPDEYSFPNSNNVNEIEQKDLRELKVNPSKKQEEVKQLSFDANTNERTNT